MREHIFEGERGDRWAPHHHHPHHPTAGVPAEAYDAPVGRAASHTHPVPHHPKADKNKTLKFPAADGFRITSPRILPNGERIRWNSHHTPVVTRRWSEVHHVQHHVLYHFPKFDGFFY
ncbi:hypothetical protein MICPUN_52483 [Micromonas commoda]|uniref:Uncharacterized protein n=1 Tax=Micromonas commoda (strain RCC299 / NOUM17 / CCMP2709) TaxID=296587 RepID=C1FJN1_MICCC|nr:hypothetical protein MICPUN_52483 [Micromonas commoda]ACO70629.1 hypothetical protein MICPUN_52483 [Micromonas commoda]|eukprot:XP_002509371.1 hypothetical protein MICPUN_52483 [Micromonas commoda]